MKKRIGLVQTGGIGDIIIALPIADHFLASGCDVVWPIEAGYHKIFQPAKPSVNFVPVERSDTSAFHDPVRVLRENGCDRTIILYSYLRDLNVVDPRLAHSLKFDEYKYAIAGVPFSQKWDLRYERDMEREERLFNSLGVTGDFICFHGRSSDMNEGLKLPPHMTGGLQVIEMNKRSDDETPFDWRLTLERATRLILIDSCFANLVEQANIGTDKTVIIKNQVGLTPVFKNGWKFLSPASFE